MGGGGGGGVWVGSLRVWAQCECGLAAARQFGGLVLYVQKVDLPLYNCGS